MTILTVRLWPKKDDSGSMEEGTGPGSVGLAVASFLEFAPNKIMSSVRGLDDLSGSHHTTQHIGPVIPEPKALPERLMIIQLNGALGVERFSVAQCFDYGISGPFNLPPEQKTRRYKR